MAFDLKGVLKASSEFVSEKAKNISDAAMEKSKEAAGIVKEKAEDVKDNIQESIAKKKVVKGKITLQGEVKLLYLLMAADGEIAESEMLEYKEMAKEIDENFDDYGEQLMTDLASKIASFDQESYITELNDYARDVIVENVDVYNATAPVKLFIWNAIVIALADEVVKSEEASFINYIAKKMDVDKSIVPEMKASLIALKSIDREIEWVKSENRSYAETEKMLNELSSRRDAIINSVHILIAE